MSSVAVLLLLLSAGLQSAFSLECYNCSYSTKDECATINICSNGKNQCLLTVTESNISNTGLPFKFFTYSCGVKEDCDKKFSMSVNNTVQRSDTTCCNTDKCKPQRSEPPKISAQKNKLQCPYCSESNTDKCKNTATMECTGDENKCFTYSYSHRNTPYAMQGCMQTNMCETNNPLVLPGSSQFTKKTLVCSHAPSVLPSLLGPVAYGLLLLKLIS
ncbi:hypothetical protein XENTR_v10019479 [Xenopus tropicalis]|uniref:Phospholipase A2 inhibitor and Ly6/PLAUR domain-containing protein n=1 Tax=Xenopus tropicalis TaxID=8364 RepID=A0A8J0QSL2_XENTR|nr:phospholipase A2 inhibitor and Ly6/PLAUR domain-containing protein [Xenopus tropicalis]KAE8594175.1 hypothetical protein XENTR_v10019479 [Xenopus tropicalis]|eukprot:XP_002939174.1 PREDICTED: phospholipase A2 inhibitor and Ly6/PLAUR domain-containing protein-like [Xenopus tropicalis]